MPVLRRKSDRRETVATRRDRGQRIRRIHPRSRRQTLSHHKGPRICDRGSGAYPRRVRSIQSRNSQMTPAVYDAVVIGAGIVGAACAAELSREGLRTAIVEAGITGGGTTAAGMGHLVVMDDSEAQFALTKYSLELWEELAPELPRAVEFDPCGTIWVAADDEEMAAAQKKKELYDAGGVKSQIIDGQTIEEAEPHLRKGLAGGLVVEGDSVVYPPCAASYLVDRAVRAGASLNKGIAAV